MNNENLETALQGNVARIMWLAFAQVFLLIMPIAVPFFQSKGLSMQEVFSLQALFSAVVLLTEMPSGYIADYIGRRRTLILGGVFAGVGHSLLVVADGFWGLAAFEVALAIGHSLVSGADIAIAYDSELALTKVASSSQATKPAQDRQRQVVGKLFAMRTFSEAVAAVVCSLLLLHWTSNTVVWVQAVVGWIPLLVACTLFEPPGDSLADRDSAAAPATHWANLRVILDHLWNHSLVLRLCLLALCIWSLTTFYAVWLLQKLWEIQGVELVHFGYLWAVLSLVATAAGRYAHWLEEQLGTTTILVVTGLLPIAGYIMLVELGVVGGLVASLSFFIARGLGLVVLRDALNRRVPSEFRATANSVASFGFRAAFVLTGPWIGYGYDLWGMQTTLQLLAGVAALIFISLMLPLILTVRRTSG